MPISRGCCRCDTRGMIRAAADGREALGRLVGEPLEAAEFSCAVDEAVRRVIDYDGWCLFGMDPGTGLRIAQFGGRGTDYTTDLARNEAVMTDVNGFRELSRAPVPAGWLSAEHPGAARSFRFNEIIRPSGFRSELRFLLRDRGRVWGGLTLFSESASTPYGDRDVGKVASLAGPLTRAVRAFPGRDLPRRDEAPPAGVVAVSPDRGIVQVSEGAQAWLDELVPGGDDETTAENMTRVAHDAAHAVRRGDNARAATCLRTVRGHWLRVEAVSMDLGEADVAVTFQAAPVRHAAEAMSESCALTGREREVLRLLVHGHPAKQIARRLGVSDLTVHGHLRSIYRKCRVRGRDELFARLA
jgi:DNA-binding CsgD family transcriptional regulator